MLMNDRPCVALGRGDGRRALEPSSILDAGAALRRAALQNVASLRSEPCVTRRPDEHVRDRHRDAAASNMMVPCTAASPRGQMVE